MFFERTYFYVFENRFFSSVRDQTHCTDARLVAYLLFTVQRQCRDIVWQKESLYWRISFVIMLLFFADCPDRKSEFWCWVKFGWWETYMDGRWKQTVYVLCAFGFLKDLRPSDSFINEYLTGPNKNFTNEQASDLSSHHVIWIENREMTSSAAREGHMVWEIRTINFHVKETLNFS